MYVVVVRFYLSSLWQRVVQNVCVSLCRREKRLGSRERSVKEETRKERRFLFAKSGIG